MYAQCAVSMTLAERFRYGKISWDKNKTESICQDVILAEIDNEKGEEDKLTGIDCILFERFIMNRLIHPLNIISVADK